MIIIGHEDIPYRPLYYVESVEEIKKTPPGSTLWLGPFSSSKAIARHCFENGLGYAVMAETVNDALKANALHAHYIVAPMELAREIQKVAETYLFDAKILLPVDEESEMEEAARAGIDGVIFQEAVIAG